MASTCMILRRGIATSCICHGKRNFRKFLLYNKRGSRQFKEAQMKNPDPEIPIDSKLPYFLQTNLHSMFIYNIVSASANEVVFHCVI